jgi:hypothetical protein
MSKNQNQNGISLIGTWRELVMFVSAWGGATADLMTLLRDAKEHVHLLHEREVLGIKEIVLPPEAIQERVASFKDQRKVVSSFGVEFPKDDFQSLL